MRTHHINCGTLCPATAPLINGRGRAFDAGRMICHCLIVEAPRGLLLVDTGLGLDDVTQGAKRLGRGISLVIRPHFDPNETAVRQLASRGYSADDVKDIVVTHLDLDHAGGLPDFPNARVHVFASEHRAALARATLKEKNRYVKAQWAHGPVWNVHEAQGERWFGFECVRDVAGTGGDVLLVPTVGHSRGHCAVAVRADDGWLLHCGDAYFHHNEIAESPSCPPALAAFQHVVALDNNARLRNRDRLRALHLAHGNEVRLFSAHDPDEFDGKDWSARG